ncbi:hypothetical protein HDG34_002548 [Paraburkholderia sp. HC6.4b]|uniref:AlbA family DNA-binding domain-containing protein n=1 Tax=unclassified Paraburkholderia TaxID=2615204 RepID=UPI00160FA12B|nr:MULTISPECIES: ATP-binding protein [unclassified Paraburkholderia]MBB5408611.1 hypothetical protein [Paraburkholderia sp. HC6.4b]MBB5450443.1 hypothetical protein [Paraburkholderia sp. Kb1A]
MYETLEEVKELFNEAEESISLEFKSGLVFNSLSSDTRRELVKDVTAFANSGGGTILVGVAESKTAQRNIATDFEPVTNGKISVDQITAIIKSNTDPVFKNFHVSEIANGNSGRLFVIRIEQADTAHQNRLDHKYYHRVGAISEPMYDFAIRDVMNRRTCPKLMTQIDLKRVVQNQDLHHYQLAPTLINEGNMTAHHWCLHIDVPIFELARSGGDLDSIATSTFYRHECYFVRTEYSSERVPTRSQNQSLRILPGETRELVTDFGFPRLDLFVKDDHFRRVLAPKEPPIFWALFVDNAARLEGFLSFDEWCRF